MKTFVTLGVCLLFLIQHSKADHITGGEMSYKFLGGTATGYKYRVSLKLFMRCNSGRQFNDPIIFGVFDKGSSVRNQDVSVPLGKRETLTLTDISKCITNPPQVCYEVGYYSFDIALAESENGYLLAAQVVFRIQGISNLIENYDNVGATYTTEIPGSNRLAGAAENNSALFTGNDMVVVCSNNSFSYSFGAKDDDGDELRFSFCNAYQGGFGGLGNNSNPPEPPPYFSVPYSGNFNGSGPLGGKVKIDPATGLITGIAPSDGVYVVTVCVQEVRGGVVIAVQRKDIQINISGCSIASASIPDEYMLCGTTRSIGVTNFSSSPLISTYNWDFMNAQGDVLFSANSRSAQYTFPTEGDYKIKLVINRNGLCADSSESTVKVYPGFFPEFNFAGLCYNKPTRFTDATTSVFGQVNDWTWTFDRDGLRASADQNPEFTYNTVGKKSVRLIVSNSVGCRDTIVKTVDIIDKPPINLAFRDTLICLPDDLQLLAGGRGIFQWTPAANMINPGTASPEVSPIVTTKYYVDLDDNGCLNRDSVTVNVVDHVTLSAMADTTICAGDTVTLRLASNGLKYTWTPSDQLSRNDIRNPFAITPNGTLYQVNARIGNCSADADVMVNTVAYPKAFAGADTMICYQTFAQLDGTVDGNSFAWSSESPPDNPNTLSPVVRPAKTTAYILTAYDVRGCPKPGRDTVLVAVLPDIVPDAGNDTTVVVGQALQLHASGGIRYAWSPAEGMNDHRIADPKVSHNAPHPGIRYQALVYNEAGCVDSAFLTVKVFNTLPSIFVPNAFTPNGDGKNDELRFVAAGMQRIEYFHVYNRYGQLVFTTFTDNNRWNGTVGGVNVATGTFVWMVKAVDYHGDVYFRKGTVTVIR